MLVEFSVSNFRSFRDRQTFSMVAAPRLGKAENKFKPEVFGEKKFPSLLKVAAIYGPNASGKSSLMHALGIIKTILNLDSKRKPQIPVSAFRFDPELTNQPSTFEYHFIQEGMRYQFVLEATPDRIHKEALYHYPKGDEKLLYLRELDGSLEKYTFGKDLEGGEIVHNAWRKLTAHHTLFLEQASANSSDELMQLKHPLKWFENFNVLFSEQMSDWSHAAKLFGNLDNWIFDDISDFLNEVDVPVTKIRTEEVDNSYDFKSLSRESRKEIIQNLLSTGDTIKTTLTHSSALGEAEFDFTEESSGTRNLIGFWLPWSILGKVYEVLAFDELDTSLHPKIVETLVKQHISNTNAQLIFSTHDTHLMNSKLLRRDQFWITERDRNGATQLFAIHDFLGRESEDIEKRYFEGRYRGLPIVGNLSKDAK